MRGFPASKAQVKEAVNALLQRRDPNAAKVSKTRYSRWLNDHSNLQNTIIKAIYYFIIKGEDSGQRSSARLPPPETTEIVRPDGYTGMPRSSPETQLFKGLRQDVKQAARDLDNKAVVMEDISDEQADREPWLVYAGFPTHLRRLQDSKIKLSFQLLKKANILQGASPSVEAIRLAAAGRLMGRIAKRGEPMTKKPKARKRYR